MDFGEGRGFSYIEFGEGHGFSYIGFGEGKGFSHIILYKVYRAISNLGRVTLFHIFNLGRVAHFHIWNLERVTLFHIYIDGKNSGPRGHFNKQQSLIYKN
jgi:hypothetical protein